MRTTNNLGGDGGDQSSIRTHQAPGGTSNFSLGWGNDVSSNKPSNVNRQYNNSSNIFGSNDEENKVTAPRPAKKYYGESSISFGDSAPVAPKLSTKVNAPMGGVSTLVLGSDKNFDNVPQNLTPAPVVDEKPAAGVNQTSVQVHNPPGGRSQITFG